MPEDFTQDPRMTIDMGPPITITIEGFTPGPPMTAEEYERRWGKPREIKAWDFLSPEDREILRQGLNAIREKHGKPPLFPDDEER
jgi:hypothetical protein